MTNSKLVIGGGAGRSGICSGYKCNSRTSRSTCSVGRHKRHRTVSGGICDVSETEVVCSGRIAGLSRYHVYDTGLIALGDSSVIVLPGPINEVIFGVMILGLGMAKGIRSARLTAVAARRS
jgi:hypothetical protein